MDDSTTTTTSNEVAIHHDGVHLHITRRWFDKPSLIISVGIIIIATMTIVAINYFDFDGDMMKFIISFVCIVLMTLYSYTTLAFFFNETTIMIDNDYLRIRHSPIPWWIGNHKIESNKIQQIYCSEVKAEEEGKTYSDDEDGIIGDSAGDMIGGVTGFIVGGIIDKAIDEAVDSVTSEIEKTDEYQNEILKYKRYDIYAVIENDRTIKLLKSLQNPNNALLVERTIEDYLDIKDKTIEGEINSTQGEIKHDDTARTPIR